MSQRSSIPGLFALAALGLAMAACAPTTAGGPGLTPASTAFSAADFAWSTASGNASIDGRIDYRQDGRTYDCTGSIGLTPVTPYTQARFQALYGSTERAAVPEAVIRARTVPDPNADYRGYVRSATCDGGRFRFDDLPNGSWFVIAPVSAGGDARIVLMRRVQTVGGRTAQLTL